MRAKTRSDFALRLLEARERSGLSQTAAAKAVGMSQSAYAAAETTGNSSTKTSQLANLFGVRGEWLATGTGPMTDRRDMPTSSEADQAIRALHALAKVLNSVDKVTRSAIANSFSILAAEPDQLDAVIATVKKLLPAPRVAHTSQHDSSADLVDDLDTSEFNDGHSGQIHGGQS